jgi:hypothetical protein
MNMVQRRTDQKITQAEQNAFSKFFEENPDYNTEENGRCLRDYLLSTWGVVIEAESLQIAKAKLIEAGLLKPMSAATAKLRAVISTYPREQFDAFSEWFETQKTLINGDSDESFANAANLLTELRGRPITQQKIVEAIGRLMYRGTKLHFTAGPAVDRSMVNGKVNHAATSKARAPGVLFSKDELSESPLEARRHKPDPVPESQAPDAVSRRWQARADAVRGSSHAMTEQARRILVAIPGTSQVDWEATCAARERFVGSDRSVR